MIEGIEILAQSEIMASPSWTGWILVMLGIGIVGILMGLAFDFDWLFVTGIVGGLMGIVGVFFVLIINPKEPTGRYEYQVTIDDNVSFTEFYENYEVVGQNGKIWTIRDKDTAAN